MIKGRHFKKEIVFFPYLASMWDCLEGIWQSMVRDGESCLVSVVPIPYMELNSDGTVRAWHCDASKFPSYVPVVDWHTYDLAAHRPDIIFIHNPYDGINLVSRVASQYYAAELKKYTSLLVYVPYFVSGPHVDPVFCRLPGVLYADRVIVESENIKQQYEQNYPGGNPPPGKFLALGSSKYDKVRSSRRADFFLPPDWRRLIKGRKVILYNLSIRDAMEQREQFIPNLRHVLILFQCQRELVLWWRPHPLLQAAFMAIHPSQGRAYCQLVRQYQDEGWGIYDVSAGLQRAMAWTDAYYGDLDAAVWLYMVKQVPALVQDMAVRLRRRPGMMACWIFCGWCGGRKHRKRPSSCISQ